MTAGQGSAGEGPPSAGRSVVVTGGAGGIGRAICTAFAALGDRVALVHRPDSRDRAGAVLSGLPGDGHAAVAGDLATAAGARKLAADVATALGGIDVLVNNAGAGIAHPPLTTDPEEWAAAWEQVLAVNLLGPVNLTHAALPFLRESSAPRVVNVSSRGAFRGEPDMPAYGASKAALNSFTQSMALALGPVGIAVSAVAPGFVDTGMARWESGPAERRDAIRAQSPLNRVARADEVADAVVYLAGAEWATGSVLDLNGASYLR